MGEYFKKFIETFKKNTKFEEFVKDAKSEAELKLEKAEALKDVLNLKTLREMTTTPDSRIKSFRRFVLKEDRDFSQSGYFGYYNSYNAQFDNLRDLHFETEANFLKDMEVSYNTHVKFTKEVNFLKEMTDEQILCYYTLVKEFKQNHIGRININYAKYYLLEVANLIYQENPVDACSTMFSFWDALVDANKRTYEDQYFLNVCNSFMVAHPDLIAMMTDNLKQRGCMKPDRSIYEEIAAANYHHAEQFVRENARLLKEEELCDDEDYKIATWKSMPYVFEELSRQYAGERKKFQKVILVGYKETKRLRRYPMKQYVSKNFTPRKINEYEGFEWNEYINQWVKTEYRLEESVQDFLNIIHLYTESFMRELFGAKSKRKRTAARVLNKKYTNSEDNQQNVSRIKALIQDTQFETAIYQGIETYIKEEKVVLPKQEKKKTYHEEIYDMDHVTIQETHPEIQQERLRQAQRDAEDVLELLHSGEIDYDAPKVVRNPERNLSQTDGSEEYANDSKVQKEESDVHVAELNLNAMEQKVEETVEILEPEDTQVEFGELECRYLRGLLEENEQEKEDALQKLHIPENILMKQINQVFLDAYSDILLERIDGETQIVEDYIEELEKILG